MRKPNCKCLECEKEIYRRPAQLVSGNIFCSSSCSNKRFKKPDIICPVCEKIIDRARHVKICSRECSNVHRSGIKYKQGRPNDKSFKFRKLKSKLLETQNKCNRCTFDFIEILEVHHKIERCNGGTDNIDNLELLCPNCHSIHHYNLKNGR